MPLINGECHGIKQKKNKKEPKYRLIIARGVIEFPRVFGRDGFG